MRERIVLCLLLIGTFALRAWQADQPIVENYVGRQIPTAMVARNLERGSGFLRPQLDTAPFPNLFLVEPPLYQAVVVALRRATGLSLTVAGRLVSAMGITLGAWGLYRLSRRRAGPEAALFTVASFAAFPVLIRYGRAFQPDALMLGLVIAGVSLWDEYEASGKPWRLLLAWVLLALGFALKVTAAHILVPLLLVIIPRRRYAEYGLAIATLLPAGLWYGYVATRLLHAEGSLASLDNGAIWLGVLIPTALARGSTYVGMARSLGWRALTPLGTVLAAWGLVRSDESGRLWRVWAFSALATLTILAGKTHHEYYWMAITPPAAAGIGCALGQLVQGKKPSPNARDGKHGTHDSGWKQPLEPESPPAPAQYGRTAPGWTCAVTLAAGLLAISLGQSASTWRTPEEWAALPEAVRAIQANVPDGAGLIAPEALLFYADRRGYRLEIGAQAQERAAREWGQTLNRSGSLALVQFYRRHGARYLADLCTMTDSGERRDFHEAIRRQFPLRIDRPGTILADLDQSTTRNEDQDVGR